MKLIPLSISLLLLCGGSAISFADNARGLELARQVDAADSGWGDETVDAQMVLIAANGRKVTRTIHSISLEIPDAGNRSLVKFKQPKDVDGTAFLTHSKKTGNDDQWLYLPALKRVKRISSSNRSGPFMGSEFAYEDIASEAVERYTYKFIGETRRGEFDCFAYERYPVHENSGYTKQVVYADKEHLRIIAVEYYDRKSEHLKTLTRRGYRQVNGFWRATEWKW